MKWPHFWTLIPLLVAFGLFAWGVPGAGFVADDAFNLAEHANHGDWAGEWSNPTYAHAGGDRGHIWRPIPALAQHVAASGLGRVGSTFRGLNLGVHLLNVFLIGMVIRRLGGSRQVAGLIALFWTTHPAMPEAVCWSSDIYDLLATSFALGAIALVGSPTSLRRLAGLAVLTGAACLCKESSVALVPVLALVSWGLHGRRQGILSAAASGIGALGYSLSHTAVTAQGYMDAVHDTDPTAIIDAGLMAVGWWTVTPNRAPMAHLFNQATDQGEVWVGASTIVALALLIAHQYRNHARARYLLLGGLSAIVLLGPAAVGIPFIGVAPFRYIYLPMAVGLAIAGGRWSASIPRVWIIGVVLFSTVGSVRVFNRVDAFQSDETLWAAERALEPDNPYAAGGLARAWVGAGYHREAIELWAQATDQARPGIRVFDRANERWLLAQTAFLKGAPDVALDQVTKLLVESEGTGSPVPAMAHCLVADSLDALGRHHEAASASVRCKP
jgi:hypothetical protein